MTITGSGLFTLKCLYGDFSTWEGDIDSFPESPEHPDGLQWLVLFRPCGHIVRFTGHDFFGVQETRTGWCIVKQAPYAKYTTFFYISHDNQSSVVKQSNDVVLDDFIIRKGKWMSDEDYKKAFEVVRSWHTPL